MPSPDNPTHYLRLAYADPPYLGACKRYGHRHEAPYGCWDDLATHRTLIDRLGEYDGWALSGGAYHLWKYLPLCPADVRVAVWVKPNARSRVMPDLSWEPVIFRGGRRAPASDSLVEPAHWARRLDQAEILGAKPARFCRWVLDLLGYIDGDDLVDLFPGSGVMGRVAAQRRLSV